MNIALLQMAQPRTQIAKPAQSTADQVTDAQSFDQVLNETVSTGQAEEVAKGTKTDEEQPATLEEVAAEVVETVEAPTLKEVFAQLGIEYDESMMFVNIEGQMISLDEMMTFENLSAMLEMTSEQLESLMQQLLGEETPLDDVWAMLEQAPILLAQITSILQGESSQVTPKEAAKVAESLKLAQMIGMKTDTVYQQEFQLKETKNALQSLVTQLQPQQLQQPQQETGKPIVFQQVVQQVAASQTQTKQETDTAQVQVQQQHTQMTTKTVTITLPADRPAQSEALAKEIQNLINRSQLSNNQGTMRLVLKLFPENLGQIRIEVMQKDGMMQARLLATTSSGKELLDSNLQQLKTAFAAQNIQMERIDVAQSLQDAERNRDQNFFNNFFHQQQEEQEEKKNDDDDDEQSFDEFLTDQLMNEEV